MSGDGAKLVARLVGLSERIESVRFSPDGTRLAVTGGLPGRMGEVQVWDVAKRKLLLSVPVTFDTLYGASWSPDGTKIAFGCADNTRARHRRQDRRAGPVPGLAQRLGARHRLLGRRLAPGLGRPRPDGQADRGRDAAVHRQHHVDHPGRPQGRHPGRRPAPEARRDRRRRLGRHAQGLPHLPPVEARHRRRRQPDPRVPRRCPAGSSASPSAPTASGSPPAAAPTAPARSSSATTTSTPACPRTSRRSWPRSPRRAARGEEDARGVPGQRTSR